MINRKILMISERPADFTTLAAALERAHPGGFEIDTVSTLDQPVEALMDGYQDAVILAHTMETEYLLRLAQKARLATPIIVLIDLESEPLINKLKEAGACDYLVRGMLTDDLIHRVLDYSMSLSGGARSQGHAEARDELGQLGGRAMAAPFEFQGDGIDVHADVDVDFDVDVDVDVEATINNDADADTDIADEVFEAGSVDDLTLSPDTLDPAELLEAGLDPIPPPGSVLSFTGAYRGQATAAAPAVASDVDGAVEQAYHRDSDIDPDSELDVVFDLDALDAEDTLEFGGELELEEHDIDLSEPESELELDALQDVLSPAPKPRQRTRRAASFAETLAAEQNQPGVESHADAPESEPEDVLAGPIAEALEALRAGAPTVQAAPDPHAPTLEAMIGSASVSGPDPEIGAPAWAAPRQGLLLGLLAAVLVLLLVLGAGLFQVQGALSGIETRLATEGTVDRPVASQPAMGEELWQAMQQRNDQLAEEVAELRDQLQRTPSESLESEPVLLPAAVPAAYEIDDAVIEPATLVSESAPLEVPQQPTASVPAGDWFINMGSFGSRDAATEWASSLQPEPYAVEVSELERDGDRLFRVRVVGIEDRGTARRLAQQYQRELYLNQLWVGKQ